MLSLYRPVRTIAILLLKGIFRLKVTGRENIPRKGSFILASNHLSHIDPVALGCASFRRLHFMAKQELFQNFLFAKFLISINCFPVKRDLQDVGAVKEAIRRLKRGGALLLFPEGTRGTEGSLGPIRYGIGFLSVAAEVPIVPAYIKGSEKVLPKGVRLPRLKRLAVYFGKPIYHFRIEKDVDRKSAYREISEEVMKNIASLRESAQ